MSRTGQVITYAPDTETDDPARDLRGLRLGLYMYTQKWGLNYSFVLLISSLFQGFIGVFIGLKGWRIFFNGLPADAPWQVFASVASIAIGLLFQVGLIAEGAQVVWLRRTDKIKIRLEQDSGWWRALVVVLVILVAFDFVLLYFAVTGARDLTRAWNISSVDQLTWVSTFALLFMNLITLLRCASVMNTSTTELNRLAVEERTKAIAEELFIDAGDATRLEAQRVWKQLGTNPRKFLPLQNAVIGQLHKSHPDFFPADLGGDTWCFDFDSNTFTALTPDLYNSLLGAKRNSKALGGSAEAIWSMGPEELSEAISMNLKMNGQPRFVDMTVPDEPLYSFQPPGNFEKVFNKPGNPTRLPSTAARSGGAGGSRAAGGGNPTVEDLATGNFSSKEDWIKALSSSPALKMQYAQFLISSGATNKPLKGKPFLPGQGVEVFDLFNLNQLVFHFNEFLG
jgi:hypothetical protein